MTTATELSTAERLQKLLVVLTVKDNEFSGLTGKTLRNLIDEGAVSLRHETEVFEYAPELFKGADDQTALAFMEANPRCVASGFIDKDDATIVIDTLTIGLRKNNGGLVTIPGPALTKKQMVDFANTFHKADEFEIGENFAYAWVD